MADKNKLSIMERLTGRTNKIEEVKQVNESSDSGFIVKGISHTKKQLLMVDVASLDDRGLYELYNRMDEDAVISASLDLFADNATIVNTKTGHVAAIESPDIGFKEEINDFLWNILKIDTEAWEYVRTVVKYGRLFLDTKASNNGAEWSFIEYPNSYDVKALTIGQDKVKYYAVKPSEEEKNALGENPFKVRYEKQLGNSNESNRYELYDEGRFISAFNSRRHTGKMVVHTEMPNSNEGLDEELYIRTGKSILDSVVNTWQTLTILEDQLTSYRLAKSNVFKLVQVNIDGSTNKQAEEIMAAVEDSFKSSETLDLSSNIYGNRQSPIPKNDFVYVPVKGQKGSVTVQEVGSQVGTIDLSDINYFRNKLFAGLGVLKAYLGWEESTPGGLGDSTLTKLDERMSKRVKRLQSILKNLIDDIIKYYWIYSKTDRSIETMPEYSIVLGKVSSAEEDNVRAELNDSLDVADRIMMISDDPRFSDKISNDKLFKYVFESILGIDTSHIDTSAQPEDVQINKINTIPLKGESKYKRIAEARTKKFGEDDSVEESSIKKFGEDDSHEHFLEGTIDDLYMASDLKLLLEEHDIFLVSPYTGKRVLLEDAINTPGFKKNINEETYKSLKQLTREKDPKRVEKSKKLTVKYKGLDDDNNILFQVTAEDPKANAAKGRPTSYETKLQLKDLVKFIKDKKDGDKDADLVQRAMQGDVAVSCECPASKYWGQQYVGTKNGYSIEYNDIAPTRNIPTQVVCKHVLTMLSVAPFWWNTIVRDLRAKGVLKPKEEPKKEERNEDIKVDEEIPKKEKDKQVPTASNKKDIETKEEPKKEEPKELEDLKNIEKNQDIDKEQEEELEDIKK